MFDANNESWSTAVLLALAEGPPLAPMICTTHASVSACMLPALQFIYIQICIPCVPRIPCVPWIPSHVLMHRLMHDLEPALMKDLGTQLSVQLPMFDDDDLATAAEVGVQLGGWVNEWAAGVEAFKYVNTCSHQNHGTFKRSHT